jgi:hypothetical protein
MTYAYAHPVFLSTPLHYLTAALFTAIALIIVIGTVIELIGLYRAGKARRAKR